MASLRRIIRYFPSPSTTSRAWAWAAAPCSRPTTTPALTSQVISGRRCSKATMSAPTSPWWRASHSGGATRPALPAVLALSTTGKCMQCRHPRSRTGAAPGVAGISRATPDCLTSRPSAAASSRCICASPINGPISMARGGWRRSSDCTRRANGGSTIRHDAPDTASCCSCHTAGDTDIRRPTCSGPSRRCRACRACRSPFMKSCRPAGMPCRRAGFALPS